MLSFVLLAALSGVNRLNAGVSIQRILGCSACISAMMDSLFIYDVSQSEEDGTTILSTPPPQGILVVSSDTPLVNVFLGNVECVRVQ
jgi:hypothetical protein